MLRRPSRSAIFRMQSPPRNPPEERIGITYAAGSEARQLRIEEGGSLFFLTGIARDYNNVPVEFFKSAARPDMVRFSSILRKHRTEPERRQPL